MTMTWNDKALDEIKEQVEGSDFVITVWQLIDDLKQLNKENEMMRKALDFYADVEKWDWVDNMNVHGQTLVEIDSGKTARIALGMEE